MTTKDYRREALLLVAYPFLWIVIICLRILPATWRGYLAVALGKKTFNWGARNRQQIISGLTLAYGQEKTETEIVQMAQEVQINMIKSVADFFATSHVRNPKRFFKFIHVVGEEHLKAAYEQGRGVICLIPHLSSWEFSAVTPPMLGYTTFAASKRVKGFLMQRLMVRFRALRGMRNLSRDGSYAKLVEGLNNGECLIIMIDQDTKVKGLFVDFYGHKAYTPMGVARLALETNAVVLPMATTRVGTGKYQFTIYPPLETIRTGNETADLLANTQCETAVMEQIIRQTPTQWVWMHRRWKTTPESLAHYLQMRKLEKERRSEQSRQWYHRFFNWY